MGNGDPFLSDRCSQSGSETAISLRTRRGFTLIELLIVVAIIGVLAAVAIPQLAMYKARGCDAAARSDLKNEMLILEGYFAEHHQYP